MAIAVAAGVSGCAGVQSALEPAGEEASRLADLFWVMLAGTAVVWSGVLAIALFGRLRGPWSTDSAARLMLVGGAILPTIVISILLAAGLGMLPPLRAAAGGMPITVEGEQYWWRVRYDREGAAPVETANRIVLPRGRRISFALTSDNVIHSFWIPALAGKLDMIPGRTNRMSLTATRAGTFRGQCAELCGLSHAYMAFDVEVLEPDAFARWLEAEAAPAAPPSGEEAARGRDVFFAEGCNGCHAIRGTQADGRVGPDLTHLASRPTIAAGTLPNTREAMHRWIRGAQAVKSGNRMPSYTHLESADLDALTAFLGGLR